MLSFTYFIYNFSLYLILSVNCNLQLAIIKKKNNFKFLTSQNMLSSGVILLLSQSHVLQSSHFIHVKWNKLSHQRLWTLLKNTAIHSISFKKIFFSICSFESRIESLA